MVVGMQHQQQQPHASPATVLEDATTPCAGSPIITLSTIASVNGNDISDNESCFSSNASVSNNLPMPVRPVRLSHSRVKLREVNPHLVCVLCKGYFVDATSIAECLHSFCRSCIILYLGTKNLCPICEVPINSSKPHLSLKPDKTLQDIVYKLVPDLFHAEMKRRNQFYQDHPNRDLHLHPEFRGITVDRLVYSAADSICLSLEYYDKSKEKEEWEGVGAHRKPSVSNADENINKPNRFLRCPAGVNVSHIKKLIKMKYNLEPEDKVELFYRRESLPDDYSLMDIAYIYAWKRNSPMRLYYRIYVMKCVNESVKLHVEEKPSQLSLVPSTEKLIENVEQCKNEAFKRLEEINVKLESRSSSRSPVPKTRRTEDKDGRKTPSNLLSSENRLISAVKANTTKKNCINGNAVTPSSKASVKLKSSEKKTERKNKVSVPNLKPISAEKSQTPIKSYLSISSIMNELDKPEVKKQVLKHSRKNEEPKKTETSKVETKSVSVASRVSSPISSPKLNFSVKISEDSEKSVESISDRTEEAVSTNDESQSVMEDVPVVAKPALTTSVTYSKTAPITATELTPSLETPSNEVSCAGSKSETNVESSKSVAVSSSNSTSTSNSVSVPVTSTKSVSVSSPKPSSVPSPKPASALTPKPIRVPSPKPISSHGTKPVPAPSPKTVSAVSAPSSKTVSAVSAPSSKTVSAVSAPSPKTVSAVSAPSPKPVSAPSPKPVSASSPKSTPVSSPKPVSAPSPKPTSSPSPKPVTVTSSTTTVTTTKSSVESSSKSTTPSTKVSTTISTTAAKATTSVNSKSSSTTSVSSLVKTLSIPSYTSISVSSKSVSIPSSVPPLITLSSTSTNTTSTYVTASKDFNNASQYILSNTKIPSSLEISLTNSKDNKSSPGINLQKQKMVQQNHNSNKKKSEELTLPLKRSSDTDKKDEKKICLQNSEISVSASTSTKKIFSPNILPEVSITLNPRPEHNKRITPETSYDVSCFKPTEKKEANGVPPLTPIVSSPICKNIQNSPIKNLNKKLGNNLQMIRHSNGLKRTSQSDKTEPEAKKPCIENGTKAECNGTSTSKESKETEIPASKKENKHQSIPKLIDINTAPYSKLMAQNAKLRLQYLNSLHIKTPPENGPEDALDLSSPSSKSPVSDKSDTSPDKKKIIQSVPPLMIPVTMNKTEPKSSSSKSSPTFGKIERKPSPITKLDKSPGRKPEFRLDNGSPSKKSPSDKSPFSPFSKSPSAISSIRYNPPDFLANPAALNLLRQQRDFERFFAPHLNGFNREAVATAKLYEDWIMKAIQCGALPSHPLMHPAMAKPPNSDSLRFKK